MSSKLQARSPVGIATLGGGLAIALATLLAYHPLLDNFFYSVDDPVVLWSAVLKQECTPHFRPLHSLLNVLLLSVFGLEPFGWYLTGLLAHLASALLVANLAASVSTSRVQGLVAGLGFALFYSPHQAVCWISANCGLFCVLCVLLAAAAWLAFLDAGRERALRRLLAYAAAMLLLVVAMGFKEECVLAGPLFLGLDLCRNGWRKVLRPTSLVKYAIPAVLAVIYLSRAFDPALWAESGGVGEYSLSVALLPDLVQNFAWLFWPRATDPAAWTPWSMGSGALLVVALGAAACRWGKRLPLLPLGTCIALLGLLPALPGPFAVAGMRYSYPAAIGAAMIVGGVVGGLLSARSHLAWRASVVAGLCAWLLVNGLSIRSVEEWHFHRHSERLRSLVESSGPVVEEETAVVISPPLYNAHDYVHSLVLWHDLSPRAAVIDEVPYGPGFLERLRPAGELDPAQRPVFAVRADGGVFRLRAAADAPRDQWEAQALEHEHRGLDHALYLIRLRPPPGAARED